VCSISTPKHSPNAQHHSTHLCCGCCIPIETCYVVTKSVFSFHEIFGFFLLFCLKAVKTRKINRGTKAEVVKTETEQGTHPKEDRGWRTTK